MLPLRQIETFPDRTPASCRGIVHRVGCAGGGRSCSLGRIEFFKKDAAELAASVSWFQPVARAGIIDAEDNPCN
jgi:hypothetical protein